MKHKVISIKAGKKNSAPTKRKAGPGRPLGMKNKPKPRSVDSPYLTIDEFCARFHISRPTFTQRHRHSLRVVKFGLRTLIPIEEAERYAESLMQEPTNVGPAPARRKGGVERAVL